MESNFLEAGKIVNTHGVRGEVKLQPWADSPDFPAGCKCWYIDGVKHKVMSAKVHKGCVIAALEGVFDVEGAIKLKNKTVCISRADVTLEEGRFFISDLIGQRALDADTGALLGYVAEILPLPANDVYVIKAETGAGCASAAREILIPAVPEFVIEINPSGGYIRFRLIEGM